MDYKSIFKTKRDSKRNIEYCKAVLVARDFIHTEKELISVEISPIFIWNYHGFSVQVEKIDLKVEASKDTLVLKFGWV